MDVENQKKMFKNCKHGIVKDGDGLIKLEFSGYGLRWFPPSIHIRIIWESLPWLPASIVIFNSF